MTTATIDMAQIPTAPLDRIGQDAARVQARLEAKRPAVALAFAALADAIAGELARRARAPWAASRHVTVHMGDPDTFAAGDLDVLIGYLAVWREGTAARWPTLGEMFTELALAAWRARAYQDVLRRRAQLRALDIDPDEPVDTTWTANG